MKNIAFKDDDNVIYNFKFFEYPSTLDISLYVYPVDKNPIMAWRISVDPNLKNLVWSRTNDNKISIEELSNFYRNLNKKSIFIGSRFKVENVR